MNVNGVPMHVRRGGEMQVFYLSTRRSGDIGAAMRRLRAEYEKSGMATAAKFKAIILMATRAENLVKAGGPDTELEKLSQEQDVLMGQARELSLQERDAAEALVKAAIAACHGDAEAEGIMDCLTDRQVRQCIAALNTGEEPEDFFPSPATPLKLSGSGRTEDGGKASS